MGERARAKERETERGGGKPINQATVLLPFPPSFKDRANITLNFIYQGCRALRTLYHSCCDLALLPELLLLLSLIFFGQAIFRTSFTAALC